MRLIGLIFLALLLVGCGGAAHERFGNSSQYAGSYEGTWENQAQTQSGDLDIVIDNGSEITGSVEHPTYGIGTVTGLIATDGDIEGKFTYPGNVVFDFEGAMVLSGTDLTGNIAVTPEGGGSSEMVHVEIEKV